MGRFRQPEAIGSGHCLWARRLLWPGLMTAVMMIVLLGLGTWQVRRLMWKQTILAQVDLAEASAPVPLPSIPAPFTLPSIPAPFTPTPFTKVFVTGTFLNDRAALYGAEVKPAAAGPAMGARMIVPLRREDGSTILVDRGWVPLSRPEPIEQPAGVVRVSGYIRMGDHPGWFSAVDDPAARRFFTLDPAAIGAAAGVRDAAPFILVALGDTAAQRPLPGPWPDPARYLPRPPNNHLAYAITWYGLAIALLVIFFLWAKKGSAA